MDYQNYVSLNVYNRFHDTGGQWGYLYSFTHLKTGFLYFTVITDFILHFELIWLIFILQAYQFIPVLQPKFEYFTLNIFTYT